MGIENQGLKQDIPNSEAKPTANEEVASDVNDKARRLFNAFKERKTIKISPKSAFESTVFVEDVVKFIKDNPGVSSDIIDELIPILFQLNRDRTAMELAPRASSTGIGYCVESALFAKNYDLALDFLEIGGSDDLIEKVNRATGGFTSEREGIKTITNIFRRIEQIKKKRGIPTLQEQALETFSKFGKK